MQRVIDPFGVMVLGASAEARGRDPVAGPRAPAPARAAGPRDFPSLLLAGSRLGPPLHVGRRSATRWTARRVAAAWKAARPASLRTHAARSASPCSSSQS